MQPQTLGILNSSIPLYLRATSGEYPRSLSLSTRAGSLVWSTDNIIKVGHIGREAALGYNDDYSSRHPYVPFNDYGNYSVSALTGEYSSNTVSFEWTSQNPLTAYQKNGLGYTVVDTTDTNANVADSSATNLSNNDRGLGSYSDPLEENEHGTFVIGPQAAYNRHVIIPTKQYAYWTGKNASNSFERSFLSLEESGVAPAAAPFNGGLIPRLWDEKRSSWHMSNTFSVIPQITRSKAWSLDNDVSVTKTNTRSLSFYQPTTPTSGGQRQRYNMGDLSLSSEDGSFSMYMKFMPSGISTSTNYVTLFQNHGMKVNLENKTGEPDFQLVLYTKNHVDASYRNGLPDNFYDDYGFEPSPTAKTVDRSLVQGSDNVINEWVLGSNSNLKAELNSANYYATQKFALGGFNRAGIQCLERTASTVTDKGKGILATTPYDPELLTWWNACYRFPDRIKLNQSTSLIVSYDGAGHSVRKEKLANQLRHPYNSGIVYQSIPTLSVMYGPIEDELSYELNGYSQLYNEVDPTPFRPHTAQTYASYDLNFVGVKPIQSLSDAQADSRANQSIYGYSYKDYFASGYIGDSYYYGTLEEFGYSNTFLSSFTRKELLDSSYNLSNIVSRDVRSFPTSGDFNDDFSDDFSIASSKFVRFRVDSGNVSANTFIGGIWDQNSWGDPRSYAISSAMMFNVTDYPAREEYSKNTNYLWNLYPFPDDNDIVIKAAVRHVGQQAPTIYFDVVDREIDTSDYRPKSLANYSTKWTSNRYTLPASGTITNIMLSGVFDGGCGTWDFRDKAVRLNVEYPEPNTPFEANLDVFAVNLEVDWFKTKTKLTGVNGETYYVPLYTIGNSYTSLPSGIDLYVAADRMVKGMDLYTVSRIVHSGSLDLTTYGSSTGFSGQTKYLDLFTKGKETISSGIDLYMADPQLIKRESLTLYLGESRTYYSSSGTVELFTEGLFASPSGGQVNLYVKGNSIYGDTNPEYVLPLYLSAPSTFTNPDHVLPLYLESKYVGYANSLDLHLANQWTGINSSVNMFIKREGRLDGGLPSGVALNLYIERSPSAASITELFTQGHDPHQSGIVNLYTGGSIQTSNEQVNLIVGNYQSNSSVNLHTRGFA